MKRRGKKAGTSSKSADSRQPSLTAIRTPLVQSSGATQALAMKKAPEVIRSLLSVFGGEQSGRFLGQIAQHVVQHAAMLNVFDLDRGIDPAFQRDILYRAIGHGDGAGHFL